MGSGEIAPPVTTRLLDENDVAHLRHIRLEALRLNPDAFASSEADWLMMTDAEWRRHILDNRIFVAFRGMSPVGIMGYCRQRASKMQYRATVIMVYVRQDERGFGTAAALLDFLTGHARAAGIRQLELAVRADNQPACRFYLRTGFSQIGRVPAGLCQDGYDIDEILMARRIDDPRLQSLSTDKDHTA
ncbi:GNAT family N-acetyltransferase [Pararhizobium antarcticum]|uniref:N-acetyltransferase domain-containing protein n=1 Tax=Pararhizobium antarcticum TaxID=1798805 RepID=A0A657LQ68_9HYPH|nr:GNAT family N-acetyltransferase [Pararhizobium antarcticum]OJF93905.1 hypothetical protein AX760_21100 [Pararhizobium antarcticum]OJF99343.1 hypothetical protein AX761_11150 [Rhizobium sp. 58]